MLRTIQRRLPLSSLSRTPRALSVLPTSSRITKRTYASETSIPPSKNDDFASGGNAYYAEEYVLAGDTVEQELMNQDVQELETGS